MEGVERTGFKLEFDISHKLSTNGWTVISNKYYIDDQQESVREIDLVAYKATKVDEVTIYTALLVSCKKSEDNAWALLSKPANPLDPNVQWLPIHTWSNDKALNYMFGQRNGKTNYFIKNTANGSAILFQTPENHIFAFQEMNKVSGAPKNDKNIFNSITTLMKAQAYELSVLSERRDDLRFYQFNLLSVVDTEIVRVDFTETAMTPCEIDDAVYVADYIIQKKQTCAKIHFVRSTAFDGILEQYNQLHQANILSIREISCDFYEDVHMNYEKQEVFLSNIQNETLPAINRSLSKLERKGVGKSDISLFWNGGKNVLEFGIWGPAAEFEKLNDDQELLEKLKNTLKKYLRYEGEIVVTDSIPF